MSPVLQRILFCVPFALPFIVGMMAIIFSYMPAPEDRRNSTPKGDEK